MRVSRCAVALGFVALVGSSPTVARSQQPAAETTRISLSPEEMEIFLTRAEIVRMRRAGNGVTNSQRATLSDGRLTHDAHIQTIDDAKAIFDGGKASEVNFKDTYRYNIAGYHLGRLLGLNVPMSVERSVSGKPAAVTWWIDDVLFDEASRVKQKVPPSDSVRFARQIQTMRIFDELIQNKDRNQGNIVWTKDWTMWMIDHTRAFRLGRELLKPAGLERCDRELLERLKGLTAEALKNAAGKSLTSAEIAAVMARRDLIVKHFEDRIAQKGESVVFYPSS